MSSLGIFTSSISLKFILGRGKAKYGKFLRRGLALCLTKQNTQAHTPVHALISEDVQALEQHCPVDI